MMPLPAHMLQVTPLNAIWLIRWGAMRCSSSLFNIDWHRHPQVSQRTVGQPADGGGRLREVGRQ